MYNNSFLNRYKRLPFVPIQGGQSTILLALDTHSNEQVIIKKYHFQQGIPRSAICEIFMLQQREIVRSPYIIRLLTYYQHDQQRILVLEKCQCDLAGKQPLQSDERLSAMRQLAHALATLHSLNYAHRDVKPANLLISEQHTVKLCDFGLAGRYDRQGGTREYEPPEAFINGELSGKQADIWSFAITWIDLICGAEYGGFWPTFIRFLRRNDETTPQTSRTAPTPDFSHDVDEGAGMSDKQIIYLIERLIGSENCQRCVSGVCQPCLPQFLQEIKAGATECIIIKQCLQWDADARISVFQILQYLEKVPMVPIFPVEYVQKVEKEPVLLDQDEAPLACLFESGDQQCRENHNVSGLDVCALEWSMQSDLGEEGM